jgi:cytochrome c5
MGRKFMARLLLICALAFSGILVAQEHEGAERGQHAHRGGGNHQMDGRRQHMHSMLRHQYVMRGGLPESYEGLSNPFEATDSAIAAGQRVYEETCAMCHGDTGNGDGPAGEALDPAPSNLSRLPRMPMMSSDAYLYWTVAEGGVPIESAMPPFGEALTSEQIWSVILYLREGL